MLNMKKILVFFTIFLLGTNFAYSKCKDPKQLRFSIIPTEESLRLNLIYIGLYWKSLKKILAKVSSFTCQLHTLQ